MIIYKLGHYSDRQIFYFSFSFPFKGLVGSQIRAYFFKRFNPNLECKEK